MAFRRRPTPPWAAGTLLLLLAASCGDSTASPDAAVDAASDAVDASLCTNIPVGSQCDPVFQCGCAVGERCGFGSQALFQCAQAVGTSPAGGPCTRDSECVPGTFCQALLGRGTGPRRCTQFCSGSDNPVFNECEPMGADSRCAWELRDSQNVLFRFCSMPCLLFGPPPPDGGVDAAASDAGTLDGGTDASLDGGTPGCDPSEACRYDFVERVGYCGARGGVSAGGTCDPINNCKEGLGCVFDETGTSGECRTYCDATHPCPNAAGGEMCQAQPNTMGGLGYCNQPCDPFAANPCGTGRECKVFGAAGRCAAAGGVASNAACTRSSDCATGLSCFAIPSVGFLCRKPCDMSHACAVGACSSDGIGYCPP